MHTVLRFAKLKGRDHSEDLDVVVMILEWILGKWDSKWFTGCV